MPPSVVNPLVDVTRVFRLNAGSHHKSLPPARSNRRIYGCAKEQQAKRNGGQHKTEDGPRDRLSDRMLLEVCSAPDNGRQEQSQQHASITQDKYEHGR